MIRRPRPSVVRVLPPQALQEALAIYGRSSARLYRQIALLHNLVYNGGVLLASAAGVPLYTAGRRLPMVVAAALLVPANVAFSAFFVRRLRALPSGVLGGLGAGERELAARHDAGSGGADAHRRHGENPPMCSAA